MRSGMRRQRERIIMKDKLVNPDAGKRKKKTFRCSRCGRISFFTGDITQMCRKCENALWPEISAVLREQKSKNKS